ncbi:sarcosine oxidase subunit delta [bacterium]|nr:sarcosine oxidase subunit delta [bacterium]
MRITCPYCGPRDQREFTPRGAAVALSPPSEGASAQELDDYLHNRDNPAGDTQDLWHHTPCGTWIVADRNTVTHEIHKTTAAREAKR